MTKFVVAVVEDAPGYWSALFDDGTSFLLDATMWADAQEEADRRFGVDQTQRIDLVDDEEV